MLTHFTLPGTAGDDGFVVEREGNDLVVNVNSTEVLRQQVAAISSLTLDGLDGDDSFTIDRNAGAIPFPITVNGGPQGTGPGDALSLLGGSFTGTSFNFTGSTVDGHEGSVVSTGGISSTIQYTGLASLSDAGDAANVTVNLPDVPNPDVVLESGSAGGENRVAGSTFGETAFLNPTNSLTINLGNLGNALHVDSLDAGYSASLVINDGAGMDDVDVTNVTIANSPGRGLRAAFSSASDTLDIVGSTLSGNQATIGAGLLVENGTVTIDASTISNNTSSQSGGGIYSAGSDLTIQGASELSGNNSGTFGGAIFSDAAAVLSVQGGSRIHANSAVSGGGGIFAVGAVSLNGGTTVSENTTSGGGGGIRSNSILSVFQTTFDQNSAANGGGISSGGSLIVGSGASFTSNSAMNGGGIINDGTATISNGARFVDNTASDGGGGVRNNQRLTIDGAVFEANTAVFGGAISSGGELTVRGGTRIAGNRADQSGGGLMIDGTATIQGGTTITGNTAVQGGGGIRNNATTRLENVTIDANAANLGGGISSGGSLIVLGGAIANNRAKYSGGGIFADTATLGGGVFITGNSVDSGGGGGVRANHSLTIDDARIDGNTATFAAGISNGGLLQLKNASVSSNIGEGLRSGGTAGVAIENTSFQGNTGSGFVINNATTAQLSNVIVAGNTQPSQFHQVGGLILETGANTSDSLEINTPVVGGEGHIRLTRDGIVQDTVRFTEVASLNARLGTDDDVVNLAAHSSTTIILDGGDPGAPSLPGDSLTYVSDGQSAVSFDGTTISTSGKEDVHVTDFESVHIPGDLVLDGTNEDDLLIVQATGTDSGTYQLIRDPNGVYAAGPVVAFAGINSLTFNGRAGNDTLRINHKFNGFFDPAGGVDFNGGEPATQPGDSFEILGGAVEASEYVFTSSSSGEIFFNGETTATISYTAVEPVLETMSVDHRFFQYTGGTESIALAEANLAEMNAIDSNLTSTVTFANPNQSVTITTENGGGSGSDTVLVEGLGAGFDADLTILAGDDDDIRFQNGPIDLSTGDLAAVGRTIVVAADLKTSGAGSILLNASRNIVVTGNITTDNGGLSLDANPSGASGNFIGIDVDGGTITTDGSGNISLDGRGGTAGVRLRNGASVESTSRLLDAGTISIDGESDVTGAVLVSGVGTQVTSTNGNILINGRSTGVGITVLINDHAVVSSSGTGVGAASISIDAASQGRGRAVGLFEAEVTSVDGNLEIIGTSREGSAVFVGVDSEIRSTGTAKIDVQGTSSVSGQGVTISSGSLITSTEGDILIDGNSNDAEGVGISSEAEIFSLATGTAAAEITIVGSSISGAAGVLIDGLNTNITTIDGDLQIRGTTGGVAGVKIADGAILASTGTGTNAATISIDGTGRTGDGVDIRNPGTLVASQDGDISVTGETTGRSGVSLGFGAAIRSLGNGTNAARVTAHGTTTGIGQGVLIFDQGTEVTSVDGDVLLIGNAAAETSRTGVLLEQSSVVSATGAGTMTLTGMSSGIGAGVRIDDAGTRVNSVDGGITITGSTTAEEAGGVRIYNGAEVSSTGAAPIAIEGHGRDTGILLAESSRVESAMGSISVIGTSELTHGVEIGIDASISSTGTGPAAGGILIDGSSTATNTEADGVHIDIFGDVLTVDGDIAITGSTGGGDGVEIGQATQIVSTGAGPNAGAITITGTTNGSDFSSNGVLFSYDFDFRSSNTEVRSLDGNISITGTVNGVEGGHGVQLRNRSSLVTSANGDIQIIGTANGYGVSVRNVHSTGSGADAGRITIEGDSSESFGVFVWDALTSDVISSVDGDIEILGNSADGAGVTFAEFATVRSSGTAAVTIEGHGRDTGVLLIESSRVESAMGAISVIGTSELTHGVEIGSGARISSAGTGPAAGGILIDGSSTATNTEADGVHIDIFGDVLTVDGDVAITGSTSAPQGNGVRLSREVEVRSGGTGSITIDGSGADSLGLLIDDSSVTTVDGDICLSGTSSGSIDVKISNSAMVSATGTGTVVVKGATELQLSGSLEGEQIVVGSGSSLMNSGEIIGGSLSVESEGTLINSGSANVGEVSIEAGGTLGGSGTISGNVESAGTVAPGESPGMLTIQGDYRQLPTGVLVLEIGGPVPGVDYDVLVVGGDAEIAGLVVYSFINGYQPAPGSVFPGIVFSGRIDLSEADIEFENLPAGSQVTHVGGTIAFAPEDGTLLLPDPDQPGKSVLIVGATDGRDVIHLRSRSRGRDLQVKIGHASVGTYAVEDINSVRVYAKAGNDVILVSHQLSLPMELHAGDGNDIVYGGTGDTFVDGGDGHDVIHTGDGNDLVFGGRGDDLIFAGGGNDIVSGGDGDDTIHGGRGCDILIGGRGRDLILGGRGDDLLIGGFTAYDQHRAALHAVRQEWTSSRPYAERVENIANGTGPFLADSGYRLDQSTVFDDDESDLLFGSLGRDWYFE